MKQLAIIAPTASGKTDLSLSLAQKLDAVILSLDSLAVYKHIDIASAKPTKEERGDITHFGIDCVEPNTNYDVIEFIEEYKKAKDYCEANGKNLIIVGGTGFYLKAMIEGLSPTPHISEQTKQKVKEYLENIEDSYKMLYNLDSQYMEKIKVQDSYRIEKALEVYLETNQTPSEFFMQNPPKPIIENIQLFAIETEVEVLRQRISLRTKKMIQSGVIDEVISLEKNYTRAPNCMASIGIKETLDYLDGKIDKKQLEELISIHTAQLAKRQRTFNNSQFKNVISAPLQNLEKIILEKI